VREQVVVHRRVRVARCRRRDARLVPVVERRSLHERLDEARSGSHQRRDDERRTEKDADTGDDLMMFAFVVIELAVRGGDCRYQASVVGSARQQRWAGVSSLAIAIVVVPDTAADRTYAAGIPRLVGRRRDRRRITLHASSGRARATANASRCTSSELIRCGGANVSIVLAVRELVDHTPVVTFAAAWIVLILAFAVDGVSLLRSLAAARRKAALWGFRTVSFLRMTSEPSIRAVVVEDVAAIAAC